MRGLCMRLLRENVLRRVCTQRHCDASIATSSVAQKDRNIFYNKYIEEIRRKKRIYTGYAEDLLKEQSERTESQDEDYAEELLAEGKRRQRAYIHSKRMREVQKGPGARLLTFQQMEQIRFLQQTDPDEWDIQSLAHSFQVPQLVIRKVLRNRGIPKPTVQEKLDNKARANHRIARTSSDTSNLVESSLTTTEDNQTISQNDRWGLPEWQNMGWFSGYENAASTNNIKGNAHRKQSSESGVHWLDEEECDFYEDLYQSMEEVDECEDDKNDDSEEEHTPIKVSTDDGRTFYSEDGELLYKV